MKAQSSNHTSIHSLAGFLRVDPLTGRMELIPSVVCFADGGGGDGDGDGGSKDSDKKFTQDDLDAIVKKRLDKAEARFDSKLEGFEKMSKKLEGFDEMKKQLAETRAALEDAGKGDLEKELNGSKRQVEQLTAKLKKAGEATTEAEAARDKAHGSLRTHVVEGQVRSALLKGGVIASGLDDAVTLMMSKSEIVDDKKTGKQTVEITIDDIALSPDEGAAEWLKGNPHFAKATGGGAGSKQLNGGGGGDGKPPTTEQLDNMTNENLLATGLSEDRSSS